MIEKFYAQHIKTTLDAAAINIRKGVIARERKSQKARRRSGSSAPLREKSPQHPGLSPSKSTGLPVGYTPTGRQRTGAGARRALAVKPMSACRTRSELSICRTSTDKVCAISLSVDKWLRLWGDSPLRGGAMARSYSGDLRERVIEAVEPRRGNVDS